MEEEKCFNLNEKVWVKTQGSKDTDPLEQGTIMKIINRDDLKSQYVVKLINSKQTSTFTLNNMFKLKNGKEIERRQQQKKQMERVVAKSKLMQSEDKKNRSSKKSTKKDQFHEALEETLSVDDEIAKLLNLVQSNNEPSEIESQFRNLKKTIDSKNPKPENIQTILSRNNGPNLANIVKLLQNNKKFEKIYNQVRELVRCLKEQLLRLFFDPADIISQLDQVYKTDGHKKMQKLLEKISAQKDCIALNDFEDDSEDESDDDENQQPSKTSSSTPKKKIQPLKRRVIQKNEKSQMLRKNSKFDRRNLDKSNIHSNGLGIHQQPLDKRRLRKMEDCPSQNSTEQSQVTDPMLRKKVCRKFLEFFENQNFDLEKGKDLSVKLEQMMRKQHPKMGRTYKKLYFQINKNLKKQESDREFKEQLEKCNDIDQGVWTKQF